MSQKPRPPRFFTLNQKKQFIEEWQASGLSITAYCEQKDLSTSIFGKWRKKMSFSPDQPSHASPERICAPPRFFTPEEKKAFIEEWKRSGLPKDTFALEKGLTRSAFREWEKRSRCTELPSVLSNDSQDHNMLSAFENKFIPVMIKPSPLGNSSNTSSKIEVNLSQGHRLSIQGPFQWETLIPLLTSILRS